mmetsp:Transcript_2137/g.4506  ORF Transcript_2137/g.4506 Transcript_2137/m.4506 type:complete len:205 (+) Transcript_2137:1200-1814(+)
MNAACIGRTCPCLCSGCAVLGCGYFFAPASPCDLGRGLAPSSHDRDFYLDPAARRSAWTCLVVDSCFLTFLLPRPPLSLPPSLYLQIWRWVCPPLLSFPFPLALPAASLAPGEQPCLCLYCLPPGASPPVPPLGALELSQRLPSSPPSPPLFAVSLAVDRWRPLPSVPQLVASNQRRCYHLAAPASRLLPPGLPQQQPPDQHLL